MKFSALNVDFNGLNLNLLGSWKHAHESIKEWYPHTKVIILPLLASLSRKWLQIGMGMQQALVTSFLVVSASMTLKDPELEK